MVNHDHPAHVLETLSERFQHAATQLGLRHVPRLFNDKHGSITSTHFRTMAEVIEVITADVIPAGSVMRRVIAATVSWYWACRAPSFTSTDLTTLGVKTREFRDAWTALDTPEWRAGLRDVTKTEKSRFPKKSVLLTIKFHRAIHHCVDYVREWGPMEFLTTETSEAMHKPLKAFFRTCVSSLSRSCRRHFGCGTSCISSCV